MKFPKEKAVIIGKIKGYLDDGDTKSIIQMEEDIIANIDDLQNDTLPVYELTFEVNMTVLDILIYKLYSIGDTNKVIAIGDEYLKHEYESYLVIYYMLLSYIGNEDIYQAVSLIRRSKLLNREDVKAYYSGDDPHYSMISTIDGDVYRTLALVMVVYSLEIAKESVIVKQVNKDYLLFRLYDVFNLMSELLYPVEVILKMSEDIGIVFLQKI